MKLFCASALILTALTVSGCSANSMDKNGAVYATVVPEDFSVEYRWIAGSMPPPYHNEFIIRINNSGGELIYYPDYPSDTTPEWKERLALSKAQIEELYQTLKDNDLFSVKWKAQERHVIGGSYEFMNVTVNSKKINVPAFVMPEQAERIKIIYETIRAFPPKNIWDKMGAQRQEYMDSYQKRKRR